MDISIYGMDIEQKYKPTKSENVNNCKKSLRIGKYFASATMGANYYPDFAESTHHRESLFDHFITPHSKCDIVDRHLSVHLVSKFFVHGDSDII